MEFKKKSIFFFLMVCWQIWLFESIITSNLLMPAVSNSQLSLYSFVWEIVESMLVSEARSSTVP
jgi:hypothetical protein